MKRIPLVVCAVAGVAAGYLFYRLTRSDVPAGDEQPKSCNNSSKRKKSGCREKRSRRGKSCEKSEITQNPTCAPACDAPKDSALLTPNLVENAAPPPDVPPVAQVTDTPNMNADPTQAQAQLTPPAPKAEYVNHSAYIPLKEEGCAAAAPAAPTTPPPAAAAGSPKMKQSSYLPVNGTN